MSSNDDDDDDVVVSSSDDEDVVMKKDLPSRSTRGSRIYKLVGDAAEADETFWGQEAWNADDDDDEYSTEEEEADIVDADFDVEENPDEEIHDDDGVDRPKRKRQHRTNASAVYQEPYRARPKPRKKRDAGGAAGAVDQGKTLERPYPIEYFQRTLRASTAVKSSVFAENYRKRAEEMTRQNEKKTKVIQQFTQQELLAEAIRTEADNVHSLNRLEQLEEEKKQNSLQVTPKTPFQDRGWVRYHSKAGQPKTLTFYNHPESIFCS